MTSRIVVDASPLIVLIKSGLAPLLNLLFDPVIAAGGVYDEILAGKPDDKARIELPQLNWIDRIDHVSIDDSIAAYDLGRGESETLSLARSMPDTIALIDDASARKCAKAFAIPFLGTGGLLVKAKREGLIGSLSEAVQSVRQSGLWISQDVVDILIARSDG